MSEREKRLEEALRKTIEFAEILAKRYGSPGKNASANTVQPKPAPPSRRTDP